MHKLAALRGHPDDDAATQGLLASIRGWWEQMRKDADTDGDGRVSRDELVAWGAGPRRRIPAVC